MAVSYPPGRSPADLQRRLTAMAARTQDMTPALKVGAAAINRLIVNTFSRQKTPESKDWKELDPKTVERRRKNSSTALVDTGRLRSSIATSSGARTITFGTNVGYAGVHQFGSKRRVPGRPFIVARPFLPITVTGQLTDSADPARAVFDRIFRSVGSYIVNGKVR
jgi:phage virion morphogenesis protein